MAGWYSWLWDFRFGFLFGMTQFCGFLFGILVFYGFLFDIFVF